MSKSIVLLSFALAAGAAGCAHTQMRGSVAMKVSDQEGYVCLGDDEVKPGDKVTLFKSVCMASSAQTRANGAELAGCKKQKLGEGTIERLLNEHYSVMKVDAGTKFSEGTIVEKSGN